MLFCRLDLMDLTRFFIPFLFFPPGPVYSHIARMFPSSLILLRQMQTNSNQFYIRLNRAIPILTQLDWYEHVRARVG